jgi:predicted enzyme related to lactoylglutathione lyase
VTKTHHGFDYIELTVADMARAKAFYGVLGWSFTDYGPEYAGIGVDGREIGGLTVGASPSTTSTAAVVSPLVILYSRDLEQTLATLTAAGAVITTSPFSFPGGRRFHFADPDGNALAVWTTTAD